ncbi:MAG: DUF4321 domain-containing protein [bacterium]
MLIKEEKKRKPLMGALLVLIIAGLLGNIFGVFLGALLPDGSLSEVLARSFGYGLEPPLVVDLWIFSVSFGFKFQLNSCGLAFMFLGLILYKKA